MTCKPVAFCECRNREEHICNRHGCRRHPQVHDHVEVIFHKALGDALWLGTHVRQAVVGLKPCGFHRVVICTLERFERRIGTRHADDFEGWIITVKMFVLVACGGNPVAIGANPRCRHAERGLAADHAARFVELAAQGAQVVA